jgi:hypothetical protein
VKSVAGTDQAEELLMTFRQTSRTTSANCISGTFYTGQKQTTGTLRRYLFLWCIWYKKNALNETHKTTLSARAPPASALVLI